MSPLVPVAEDFARVALIGVGATVVMDIWLQLLKWLNVPTLNFAFIGRWVAHAIRGRCTHVAIAKSAPMKGELAIGWLVHYAVGIAFAFVLAALYGLAWAKSPSLMPALVVGVGSVIVPLFVMQPAMGAGFASSKTATPLKNCLRSVANHTIFGLGLYVSAACIAWCWP
jgi:Protein of unknown function (DUF2938)